MKQLSGLDASFLYMETASTFGHVSGLGIYERPSADFDPLQLTRDRFGALVGLAEPMRRRLVEVPFQLDHPYWVEDRDFELDFHIRHLTLDAPGEVEQLADEVARIVGRPMDRSRPLWEVYVIDGLEQQRWAMLTKTHHATVDGAAGVLLLGMLLDTDANAAAPEAIEWERETAPTQRELLQRTFRQLAINPAKNVRTQLRLIRNVADALGVTSVSRLATQTRDLIKTLAGRNNSPTTDSERRIQLPITPAPSTPWNRPITAKRGFAMRSAQLDTIKSIKNTTGGTVNDVVMAICAGALRQYLIEHDALPEKPLRAMVPVSIRTGTEADPWTNRVSSIVADLPTNCADPLLRVALCREAMVAAKRQFDLVSANALSDVAQTASPVVATAALRLVSRMAGRINLPANVTISNVPGPRQPLYFAGARLQSYIPVSIVTDGMGLNITVHSYLDRLEFGVISAADLVPDVWHLADLHIDEIDQLVRATAA